MTAPLGNTASARNAARVFLDDDFEERLNVQVNQLAEKSLSQVGDFFKAKASNAIDTCNMSIPITSLEKWHYKKGCQIFSDLYKVTGKAAWIRIPALIATEKYALIRTAAVMGTIVELTLKGFRSILTPYQSPGQRKRGWTLLTNVPCKGLHLIGSILFGIIIGPIWIAIDAEHYILENTEKAKVDWKHADRGTIDSEEHKYDLEGAIAEGNTGRRRWKNQLENNT